MPRNWWSWYTWVLFQRNLSCIVWVRSIYLFFCCCIFWIWAKKIQSYWDVRYWRWRSVELLFFKVCWRARSFYWWRIFDWLCLWLFSGQPFSFRWRIARLGFIKYINTSVALYSLTSIAPSSWWPATIHAR